MAHPTIGADLHQPLHVHGDVLAKIALHATLGLDDLGDAAGLLLRQVLDPHVGVNAGLAQDLVAPGDADPVDVGEAHLDALLSRKVNACDACHGLPLPLLVLLIAADDPHHSVPAHHLALDADLSDRRPYFHVRSSLPTENLTPPHDTSAAHVVGH